jgi:hypothetical protein
LRYDLPPWFAVVPAGPALAAISISTATTAAAAAINASATESTAVYAATATIATPAAISSGASFVDRQIAAVEILAVELLDRRGRFFRGRHLDEAEASRATRHTILDHLGRFNIASLGEVVAQIVAGRLEREISHVKFCSHFYVCPLMLKEARNQSLNKGRKSDFLSAKRDVPML